ncbi:hypothetical protein ACO0LL_05700 [Undibacterium sp. TC4M20W]|uniref:hypothetical protein n=1 Tax=Undibacterium sp. TC4M20W TaxID=3413052 RepID=UPI003BF31627
MQEKTLISQELEQDAIKIVKQYRMMMPTPIRGFLIKLSGLLGWDALFQELK